MNPAETFSIVGLFLTSSGAEPPHRLNPPNLLFLIIKSPIIL